MSAVLELAIRIWILQQCNSIEIESLKIKSTIRNIIKGNIQSILLNAKKVNYKGLSISNVCITTSQLNIRIKNLGRIPSLIISNYFTIDGKLDISSKDVFDTLTSKEWSYLFNHFLYLNKEIDNITGISLQKDNLIVKYTRNNKPKEIYLNLSIKENKLYLTNSKLSINDYFPKDDSIYIEDYDINESIITIYIKAKVS